MDQNSSPDGAAMNDDAEDALTEPLPKDLEDGIEQCLAAPDNEEAWDKLEELAATHQIPEAVANAYVKALRGDVSAELANLLGQRAVRFHNEWFSDNAPLIKVLTRVLQIDPTVDWAFERVSLLLTVAERWDELLGLYDRALDSTSDKQRRRELLDEAAHVAKDFAGQPDRAIRYLEQLYPLKPQDAQLAASLERLLETRGRYRDLIQLWTTRLTVLQPKDAQATRARIAACWLDHLNNPAEALSVVEPLLEGGGEEATACDLLERIAALGDAPAETRKRALGLVKERYAAAGRSDDVIRVLKSTLAFAEPKEKIAAHREIAERLTAQGRDAEAMDNYAAIVTLDPGDMSAIGELRGLAERTGRHATHADALAAAAAVSSDRRWAVELLFEAATVRCDRVGDDAGGIELFAKAFGSPEAGQDVVISIGRRLAELLERNGRRAELVDVLERLSSLVPDTGERRELLGRVARLSDELGDLDRALAAWERRLTADSADMEALDATIDVLGRTERWEPLVEALRRRADASEGARSREDLVRIAGIMAGQIKDIDRAILTWREVEDRFGRNAQTVDALADLLTAAERWEELSALLATAIEQEEPGQRRAYLLGRLGDVFRQKLELLPRALDCYRSALDEEPQNATAREGLTALIQDPTCAPGAVDALVKAFSETDEWREGLSLLEQRLRVADGDRARAAILLEASHTQEDRGNDPAAALVSVGRALTFAPYDKGIERELLRLAEKSQGWAATVEAYRRAIDGSTDDLERVSELRFQQGSILEDKLHDLGGALEAYTLVRDAAPESPTATSAVIRTAARLSQWDRVAQALVISARATGSVRPELFEIVEGIAQAPEDWASATSVAEATVAEATDLSSAVAHALETRLGVWHRDRNGDAAAAERAFLRAVKHDETNAETLRMLADLQRGSPGRPLVDTLLKLAAVDEEDLDSLYEAAHVALDQVGDQELARPILSRLYAEGSERWRGGRPTGKLKEPVLLVSWTLDRLVHVHENAGEFARAVQLLVDGARLPFGREAAHALYHRAAELAASRMQDSALAIQLYRTLVAEQPDDARAIAELAALYGATGRLSDLIDLRRHELKLAEDVERRLELRLDMARAFASLGDVSGRIEALRENLAEQPGHADSIADLSAALEGAARFRDLATVLSDQAATLEERGQADVAQGLWMSVAGVAERHLSDIDLALSAYRSAVRLGGTAEALDALARLHTSRGEFGLAVGWLEQRLETSTPEDRTQVVLRLADALMGAGKTDRARVRLENALEAGPEAKDVRALLATLYRGSEAWEPLVKLLLEGTQFEDDTQAKLTALTEAADIQLRRLNTPEHAVSTLHRAADLAPQDKNVRTALADALRGAGRLDEAKTILEGLVEEFGRRRPANRATLHFHLAQVARARGDLTEALHQLDLASDMNMGHAGVLQLLGELAYEAGQLERAERAYRALLLIVRRQRPGEAATAGQVGQAEVLLQLYRLSQKLNQTDRAKELLESAFEIAAQSDAEAVKFERALRALGDGELLLRSLEARLARAKAPEGQAGVLSEIAGLLQEQGRSGEALDMRLRAVAQAPEATEVRAQARALAAEIGALDRYVARVEELALAARDEDKAGVASELFLELGEIAEVDLKDLPRALAALASAEAMGERLLDTWRAMERLSGVVGDRAGQARALRKLVEATDGLPPEDQTEALYRLAELEIESDDTREQGANTLSWALDRDPQFERAAELLRRAAASGDSSVLGLYERVARQSGRAPLLLDALERLSVQPDTSIDALREAVEIAMSLGEGDRAEALLHRAIQRTEERDEGMSDAVWALTALADRKKAANDFPGAVAWMRRAMQAADTGEAFQIGLEVAALAAGPMNDPSLAARTYEQLLERDPGDRAVWEPLLDVYRKLGEEERLEALIATTVDSVLDPADRRRLRMERARLLLTRGRRDEAVSVLQEILQEEPDDMDAANILMGVYEETGRTDDLADLLSRQLDGARGRSDGVAVAQLSLRLAALLSRARREDAIDVLRGALDAVPDDRRILQELLALYRPEDDPRDRADVMERMFAYESGEGAANLALALADVRAAIPDDEGQERALERGYELRPENDALRDRLLRFYAEHDRFAKLATAITKVASRTRDPAAAAARLREVAAIHMDKLDDPGAAAEALRRARGLLPTDRGLVRELTHALLAAGEAGEAIAEVTAALDASGGDAAARAEILRLRAELHARQGDDASAVVDLDQALSLGDATALPALSAALEQQRSAAAGRGDFEGERSATLRLVDILAQTGEPDRSRELLAAWSERSPQDIAALRALLALDTAAERWRDVAMACNRLIDLEEGDAKIEAALKLADACSREGAPMAARAGLERAFAAAPNSTALRDHLRKLYEQIGAHREHAALYLREAAGAADDAARFEPLKRGGELLLVSAGDAEAAVEPLETALRIKPGEHETTVLLSDAYTATGRLQEATDLINGAIEKHKNRRSREVAVLQHRMARVAAAAGDRSVEMAWLGVAFEADMQNGQIASELANTAMDLNENEMALKALRAITMMKNPAPMGRAMAYLRQGMIAHRQGDTRRAAILAKKAQTEDPELTEAKEFLQQIGAG
jgi:tetratricopeptide (TPR) repeat protein